MLSKEEAKENVLLRAEAEEFLGLTKQHFQLELKEERIPYLKKKALGSGNSHAYTFWKPDLEEYKKAREIFRRK